MAWASDTLAALYDAKLVATFHGTARGSHGGRVPPGQPATIHAIESWLAHTAAEVLANSRFMVREIISGFELPAERTHLVPNGIDPTWWSSGELPDRRTPLVFTWGRVHYEKGFQVLARAMSLLRNRVPRRRVRHRRPWQLPPRPAVADRARGSERHDRPPRLSSPLTASATPSTAPSCVVIPSLYEPFGIVALEALAGGAPLVVARTGGLAELIDGTGAGLLFEPGNADELASCIELVLSDDDLADEMRKHGAELLADRYSWQAIAGATTSVYAGHPSAP